MDVVGLVGHGGGDAGAQLGSGVLAVVGAAALEVQQGGPVLQAVHVPLHAAQRLHQGLALDIDHVRHKGRNDGLCLPGPAVLAQVFPLQARRQNPVFGGPPMAQQVPKVPGRDSRFQGEVQGSREGLHKGLQQDL